MPSTELPSPTTTRRGSSFHIGRARGDTQGPSRASTMIRGLTNLLNANLNLNDDDNNDEEELENEESDSEDVEFAEMMSGDNVGCFPTVKELEKSSSPQAFLKDHQEKLIREEAEKVAQELARAKEEAQSADEKAQAAEEMARVALEVVENARKAASTQTPEVMEAIIFAAMEAEEASKYAIDARKFATAAKDAVSMATRADQVIQRAINTIAQTKTPDEAIAILQGAEAAGKAANKAVENSIQDSNKVASDIKKAAASVERVKEMVAIVEEAEKIEIDRRVIEDERRKKVEILREEEEIDVEFESDDEDDRDYMSRFTDSSYRTLSPPKFTSPPSSMRAPIATPPADALTLFQKFEKIQMEEEQEPQNQQQQQQRLQPEPYQQQPFGSPFGSKQWSHYPDSEYSEPIEQEPDLSPSQSTHLKENNPIIVLEPDILSEEIYPHVLSQTSTPDSEDDRLNLDIDEKPNIWDKPDFWEKPKPSRSSSIFSGIVGALDTVGQFGLERPNSKASSRRMSNVSQDQGIRSRSSSPKRSISSDRRSIGSTFDMPRTESPIPDMEIVSFVERLPDQHRENLSRNDTEEKTPHSSVHQKDSAKNDLEVEKKAPPPPPPRSRSRSLRPPTPKSTILVQPLRFGVLDFPQEDFFLNHNSNSKVLAVNEGKLILCKSDVRNMKNQLWRSQKGVLLNVASGLVLDIENGAVEVGGKVIVSGTKEAAMTHYWGYTTDNLIFPKIDISLVFGDEHGELVLVEGGHNKGLRNRNNWSFVIPPMEQKPRIPTIVHQKPTLDDQSFHNTLSTTLNSTFGGSLNQQQVSMISNIITTGKSAIEDEVKTRITRFVPPESLNPNKAVWFSIRWDDRLRLVWDVKDDKLFLADEKPNHVESQLWTFRDGWLINKHSSMVITAPSGANVGSHLNVSQRAEDDIGQRWLAMDDGRFISEANENLAIGAANPDACEGSLCRLVDSLVDPALSQNYFILKKRLTRNAHRSNPSSRRDSMISLPSISQSTQQNGSWSSPSRKQSLQQPLLKQVFSKTESSSASDLSSRDSSYTNTSSRTSYSNNSGPPSKGRRTSTSSAGSAYYSSNDKAEIERLDSKRSLIPIVEDEPDLQGANEPSIYEEKTLEEPLITEYRPQSRTSVTTDHRLSRPVSRASFITEHRPPSRTLLEKNEDRLNTLRQTLFSKKELIERSVESDRVEEAAEKVKLNVGVSPSETILEKVADESVILDRIAQVPQSLAPAARAPPIVNKQIGPIDHTIIEISDNSKPISVGKDVPDEGISTFNNEESDITDSMKDLSTVAFQKIENKIDPVALVEEIVVEKAIVGGKVVDKRSWRGFPVQIEGNDITLTINDECEKSPVRPNNYYVSTYYPAANPRTPFPLSRDHDHAHKHAGAHPGVPPDGSTGVHIGTSPDISELPQGPPLPPIEVAGSYIKYSHAAWESFIRYKYKKSQHDSIKKDEHDHEDTLIDSQKHILVGVIEANLRKEVARLLNLFAVPIPDESAFKYLIKGDKVDLKEKMMNKTDKAGEKRKNERNEELTYNQHRNNELNQVMILDENFQKEKKKKKKKRLPEPLIIMAETKQLKEADFMIDVTAAFPTLVEHYPIYATKILQGVCYSKIPLIHMKQSELPVQLRMLSNFPCMYGRKSFDRNLGLSWFRTPAQKFVYKQKLAAVKSKTVHEFCVVPLRRLCLYEADDDKHYDGDRPIRSNSFWRPYSIFTDIVSAENSEDVFDIPFWDVVLDYKWRSFARFRFFFMWFLEIIYMALFGVATSPTIPAFEPSPKYVLGFDIVTVSLGIFFISHEFRQMLYHGPRAYFKSFYNYLDLYCYISPILIAGLNYGYGCRGYFNEWTSLTILFLWVHFMHQCRVFRSIGIFVNTLIRAVVGIVPFLVVMFAILVAFAHGLWVLLADVPDADIPGVNNTNSFKSFTPALKYTYWGLSGDLTQLQVWDGFSVWTDLFRAIFTIIGVTYLLNLLIAMLSDQYSSAFDKAEASYRLQRAQVISEIEIFWMLPFERTNRENFPEDIFFEAKPDDVDKWNEDNKIDKIEFS